jgi:hypothetical protein
MNRDIVALLQVHCCLQNKCCMHALTQYHFEGTKWWLLLCCCSSTRNAYACLPA